MRIGAHVSTAGGLDQGIDRAQEIGAEAMQVFASSPRGWAFKPIPPATVSAFREKAARAGIGPNFFHAIYLVNLGSPSEEMVGKSVQTLSDYMRAAEELGVTGVIFHGGSHLGAGFEGVFEQVVRSLKQVLEASPGKVRLLLENSAGMGQHIGASFQEMGRIVKSVGSPRMGVCLDTQHLFAAGYEVTMEAGLERVMEEFDREVGMSRVVAVHANDSKTAFGSGVDRHENIGRGQMGLEAFRVVMRHRAFRDVPFLLEVPGLDGKGPDRANVEALKGVRAEVGLAG